ncbi:MAG: hypothetical protein MAG795_00015 [Candidatus Woesearchaeota archaeon]|nr:hypothetical protein [Candidatus Woesearchaeota archaeon]
MTSLIDIIFEKLPYKSIDQFAQADVGDKVSFTGRINKKEGDYYCWSATDHSHQNTTYLPQKGIQQRRQPDRLPIIVMCRELQFVGDYFEDMIAQAEIFDNQNHKIYGKIKYKNGSRTIKVHHIH